MSLFDLANELLLCVADYLDDLCALNAFSRTNRRLYCLLNDKLYRYEARQGLGLALNWAARQGLERTAHLSLAEGANVDSIRSQQEPKIRYRSFAPQDPLRNLTPLQIAIGRRHECVVRLLVEQGADIMRTYPGPFMKATPLHVASALGLVASVHLLLERGAKLEALDRYRQTPLHYAVKLFHRMPPRHNLATVEKLLEWGARHDARDKSGRTAEALLNRPSDYILSDIELLLPQESRYREELEQDACSVEKRMRSFLEAKHAMLAVARCEKDRELRRERLKIEEQNRNDLAAQKRERQNQKKKDKADRIAERTEAQRLMAEAEKREAIRVSEAQREVEAIRMAEQGREGKQVAIGMNWTRMREKAEQRAQSSSKGSIVHDTLSCTHSTIGRLKRKDKAQCEKCRKVCRQFSFKCPDCGSVVCKDCK